jgi:hypothetical protein
MNKKNKIIMKDDHALLVITRNNGEVFYIKISKESIPKLKEFKYSWGIGYNRRNDHYYVTSTVYLGIFNGNPKYKSLRLHRFVTDAKENEHVDHRNHDTLDNRLENLKVTTNQTNTMNRKGANKTNKSTGIRNVSYDKTVNKYLVQLQVDGKNTCFGRFDTLEEAKRCAEENRKRLYKV